MSSFTITAIINGKKYRGDLTINYGEDHLSLSLFSNPIDYFFCKYIYYSPFNGIQPHLKFVKFINVTNISKNDNELHVQYTIETKLYVLHIKAKSINDAMLLEQDLVEKRDYYKRKFEIEKSIKAKYRSGIVDDIHHKGFEKLVGELFDFMGYSVYVTGGSGDGGVDLSGKNRQTNQKIIIQCKRYKGKVDIGSVRDFYGALMHTKADKGFIVTTGNFTEPAFVWVKDKPIDLIDGKRLKELLHTYYK